MAAIVYPAGLPIPQASPTQSDERRVHSPEGGPYEVRALQRDRLALQRVTFPPMNAADTLTFKSWYETTLRHGGAWFAATWPLPQGLIPAARRFLAPPHYEFIPTPQGNYWRITADFEVRGRGEMPLDINDFVDCDLLIHFDEFDAAEWLDYSRYRHPLTIVAASGSIEGETGGQFSGAGRIVNPNAGSGAEIDYDTHPNIVVNDWIVEFTNQDFYISFYSALDLGLMPNNTSYIMLDARAQDYDGGWFVQFHRDGGGAVTLEFSAQNDGGVSSSGTVTVTDVIEDRHLYSISRTGPNIRFFIDGVLSGTAAGAFGSSGPSARIRESSRSHITIFAGNRHLTQPDQLISGYEGWIDEIYVNHGEGTGITSDFTPPTDPFDADHTLRQMLGIDP